MRAGHWSGRLSAAFIGVFGVGAALSLATTGWLLDALAERDLPAVARWVAGPQGTAPIDRVEALQIAFFAWAPLAVAAYAVVVTADISTRDETRGSPDVLSRVPGFVAGMLALAAAASAGFMVTRLLGRVDGVSAVELTAAPFALVPLGLACGGLGMVVGVVTRSRRLTLMLVGAETVVVFALLVAADEVVTLDALRHLSPFHYADVRQVLTGGVVAWHVAVLLVAFVLQTAAAAALASIEPRSALRRLRGGSAGDSSKRWPAAEPDGRGSWSA